MTVDSNTSSGRGNDPEQIDLIELLLQLWRGKMTIIVAVIIAILLAVGYLMIAKEKWTSTAIITQPDAAQVATYTNALNVLYGGNAPKISEVQALPLSVSYVSTTAEGAQRRLAEYIQQVDEEVAKELEVDLKDNITLQTKTLQESLETQEVVAQEQKDLRIKQIEEALRYADEAKITQPQIQQTQDVTQDTMFLLGSDALKSMIQNEATRPLVFSPAYYQTKQTLLDIKNLKVTADTVHVYRYVMKPTLPVRRDSPKTAITLVLAVLLGGMIGAGIVLGRNALRSYKPKAL
ncbi:LPS O-antigen chain length determinant protein WzzB [Salmonella enterica subsp. enterica serovar Heidelberg]|nr:LPS O-antigen chain length determinant protein WzzB [Salmonella enterica]EDH8956606.1 LPS O-antigen chain length determinant protein WzzB [Salmonella enterica subsp. enterica serovar Heidelberg]